MALILNDNSTLHKVKYIKFFRWMALIWWILWVEKRCLLEYTIQQTIKQIEKIHSQNTHTLQSARQITNNANVEGK